MSLVTYLPALRGATISSCLNSTAGDFTTSPLFVIQNINTRHGLFH
jgi:hypothetical protein